MEKTQEELRKEFIAVTTPIIKWMNENTHPHHTVIIDHTHAELLEGEIAHSTEEFLKD